MEDWAPVWENRQLLLSGLRQTVALTLVCIVASTLLGLAVSLLRQLPVRPLRLLLRGYVELFRGSPVLIQILFVFFGAAYLRTLSLSVFAAAGIALTLYTAAYIAEVFRAGFEAVAAGQREAARSLGLGRTDTMTFVVLPQAVRVAAAPLFGQYIALVKNTSLASVIGFADLTRQGQGIVDRFGNPFQVFLVVALFYLCICYPLSLLARRLERRSAA